MNKFTALLFTVLFLLTLVPLTAAGCSQDPGETGEDIPKVALLLSGTISDQGWNAMAYNGLMQIEQDHGADVSFSENVPQSDMEEVFRGYAESGYDIIFGHGFETQDAAVRVAQEFPETIFIITSTDYYESPNVGSVSDDGFMKGFLGGVAAGVVTETGTVGFIGGMEIPPIRLGMEGFEKGAEYANPEIEVLTAFTGDFEDAGAAKEIAFAMIDQGADVLLAQADAASLGSIEAVEERNVYGIGINQDQSSLAPGNIVTSAVANYSVAMSLVVEDIIEGRWEPSSQTLGLKEGVNDLAPYHEFEEKLTQQQKDRIEQIKDDIISGELNIRDL